MQRSLGTRMFGVETVHRSLIKLRKTSCVLLLLFACGISEGLAGPQETESILRQAYSMRTSDPQQARSLLASVDKSRLEQVTQDLYDNTAAYLLIMEGDFPSAIEAYKKMIAPSRTADLRFSAHSALTALYGGTQNWSAAFDSVEYIEANIDTIENSEVEEQAHSAMLNFYNAINEDETVVSYASSLDYSKYSPRFSCVAILQVVSSSIMVDIDGLSEEAFENAVGMCTKANEPIAEVSIYAQYASYLHEIGQSARALAMLLEHLPQVEESKYIPTIVDYYGQLSQVYFETGEYEQSREYALKIVGSEQPGSFVSRAGVKAYESLYKIAESEQQFELALEYYKWFSEAQSLSITNESAKMLAIQKARQDSAEKSNQIALLDTENSLLRAQALLDAEANQNRKLLITLMIVALLSICFWVYKKRRHYLALQEISRKDALTGAANRSFFTATANTLLSNCAENNTDISLVLFDLDDFKKINDTFGHKTGDFALKAAVSSTRNGCRELDLIGRLGGEEFGIILEACDIDKALEIAEKCRHEIEKAKVSESESFTLTASFGVASAASNGYSFDALFDAADKALYKSKEVGKNYVSH